MHSSPAIIPADCPHALFMSSNSWISDLEGVPCSAAVTLGLPATTERINLPDENAALAYLTHPVGGRIFPGFSVFVEFFFFNLPGGFGLWLLPKTRLMVASCRLSGCCWANSSSQSCKCALQKRAFPT